MNNIVNIKDSSRDITIDWIAGLLIVNMIIVHIDLWAGVTGVNILTRTLFFFMAWFFYKAGMFHKVKEQRVIVNDAYHRLLVPMIIFSIIGQIVDTLLLVLSHDTNPVHYIRFIKPFLLYGALPSNLALWFLGSLFLDKVIFNWLCIRKINIKIIVGISSVFAFSFYLISKSITIPDYLGNVCFGMIFYALGYWLKDFRVTPVALILLGIVLAGIAYFSFSSIDARANNVTSGYYLLAIPFELMAIVFINNIIRFTPPNLLKLTCLHCIGRDSMSYYVTHWIVIIVCDYICINVLNLSKGEQYRWVMICTCTILLPILSILLNKYFAKSLGNK